MSKEELDLLRMELEDIRDEIMKERRANSIWLRSMAATICGMVGSAAWMASEMRSDIDHCAVEVARNSAHISYPHISRDEARTDMGHLLAPIETEIRFLREGVTELKELIKEEHP